VETKELFNEKIHKFLYYTCTYNPTAPLRERGKNYLVEILKAQPNRENEELGCAVVILALETVQCMAEWYPEDYF
jgi:hypothetical protein